jgi:L-asparagine transporter-like permease
MRKLNNIHPSIKGIALSLIALFFDIRWESALQNNNVILAVVYFLLLSLAVFAILWVSGFKFRFVLEKIKMKRVNFFALVIYPFCIYLLLKNGILGKVFSVSKVMGVLYVLLLVLIVLAPLYMESEKDKSDKVAS